MTDPTTQPADRLAAPPEDLPAREFQRFDPAAVRHDARGEPYRYLRTALDERYLAPVPVDWRHEVAPGMLPPQDLELRKELDLWRSALAESASFGLVGRIIRRMDYKRAQGRAELHERRVRALVRKSAEHLAAARRIATAPQASDPAQQALGQLLQGLRAGGASRR